MSWWSKSKKLVLATSTVILLVAVGVFAALKMRGPVFCTLVGCSGGLTVEVIGLPPSTPYQISISLPFGEKRTLTCVFGEPNQVDSFDQSCSQTGAFFRLESDVKPPEKVTVTVEANGNQFTQTFNPTYGKFQPNGPGCAPVCYNANIKMNIPK